jgi:hypothetical protein
LAYLPDLYANLRLDYLGFDFDGWFDEDRAKNIAWGSFSHPLSNYCL